MIRICYIVLISLQSLAGFGQYKWSLKREENGIKVYSSSVAGTSLKAIKVDCTIAGTYTKLITALTNVPQLKDWIYKAKKTELIKSTPNNTIYYLVTEMPWPLSNRDAVIHLHFMTDSLPAFFTVSGSTEPALVPESSGNVRIKQYKANWKVTMPTTQTVHIEYTLEVDPGGSVPAWIVNMFVDKGPYESFSKLAEILKR